MLTTLSIAITIAVLCVSLSLSFFHFLVEFINIIRCPFRLKRKEKDVQICTKNSNQLKPMNSSVRIHLNCHFVFGCFTYFLNLYILQFHTYVFFLNFYFSF